MQLVRSILFAVTFYPLTLLLSVVGLLVSTLGPRATRTVVRDWATLHHWFAQRLLGIRTRVEGDIPAQPMLIAVKHQAMFETLEMVLLAHSPVIVIKRELADLPVFGWMTRRYGVIPVDREAGSKALREMMALGKKAVAEGRPIIIYPEGTRVPYGERPPLRPGFAGLYRALGLPVVPVAVDSGRLWGRGLLKRKGTITFRVGEVIPAGLKRAEIEARVHAAINALEV
jgi:1-acyl-sn-glycerol-3-phosphate acyltransferase